MTTRLTLMLSALILAGCGNQDSAKGPAASANPKGIIISKWKTEHFATSKAPMGLVLEQHDSEITAALSELKGTNGFVVGDKLAVGNYQPQQKAIILMMGNLSPTLMPPEQWIANGGPYVKIPFERIATNLTMTTVIKNGPAVTLNLVPFNTE